MSDIRKCRGIGCPMKDDCYRFTSTSNEYAQSYFTEMPFKIKDDIFICTEFWGQSK